MNARLAKGRYGEDVAARYLSESGMSVLERNWRCRDGEIDIVARDAESLVVCEVKTRSGTAFQHPLAGVDPRKAARLRHLAARWVVERWASHAPPPPAVRVRDVGEPRSGPPGGIRIDLVGVVLEPRGRASIEHVRGVV